MPTNIDIFPWDDHFNTGFAEVDAQHRKLVEILNQLASAVAAGAAGDVLGQIFDGLVDYTRYHFTTEEKLWREFLGGDPAEATHLAAHASFIDEISQLKAGLRQPESAQHLAEETLSFLARWLAAHILESDRYMAYAVRAVQDGLPAEAAKNRAQGEMSGTTRMLIEIILATYSTLSTNTLRLMRELLAHREAEQALAREVAFRESVLQTRINAIAVCESTESPVGLQFVLWSPGMEALTGYRLEEVNQQGWNSALFGEPAARTQMHERMARARTGAHLHGEQWEIIRKDGESRQVEMHTCSVSVPGGAARTLMVLRDITEQRRLESTLLALAEFVSREHEDQGFEVFTAFACQHLGVEYAHIGLYEPTESAIHVIAGTLDGERIPPGQHYTLSGTPCHEVIRHGGQCCFPDGVQQQFPQDQDLIDLRAESYIGEPIRDREGGVIGLIVLVSRRALTQSDALSAGLRILAARIASDLARGRNQRALQASEEKHRLLAEHINDVIWTLDFDLRYTYVSPSVERMLGYTQEDVLGQSIHTFMTAASTQTATVIFAPALEAAGNAETVAPLRAELELVRRDGSTLWTEFSVALVRDAEGQPLEFVGVSRDISERIRLLNQLRKSNAELEQLATVFTHANEGIMITAPDGAILDVNAAFCRITGYDRSQVIGRNPSMLQSGLQDATFYADMWRAMIERGHWSGEMWNRRRNGDLYAAHLTISAVQDDQGSVRHFVALYTDVTQQKRYQQQLEKIAHYDPLTGLPNRVFLLDQLQRAMRQTLRRGDLLAVCYLDLDGFKSVNDTHGHDVGDRLLCVVAERMQTALRAGDILGRLSGDEFVAILLDLPSPETCPPILTRMLDAAAREVLDGDTPLRVSASLGVTYFPQPEDIDAEQLLRQADQAMYQAKLAGKNRYHVFDAERDLALRGQQQSVQRIGQALNHGEFELAYQPTVNMRTGVVLGIETLIRWRHPERGLLLPDAFLPEIADHPLAIAVHEWVLDNTLAQMAEWRGAGVELPISINIGFRALQQADFLSHLLACLERHPEAPPTQLVLEVRETGSLDDIDQLSILVRACAEAGIRFTLDDFGTGYSSLTFLQQLPAHTLKIDQRFVQDLLDDPEQLKIKALRAMLALAATFGREPIAEGVATEAHGALLLDLGCERGQGYAIARPMPAAEIPAWIADWRPPGAWHHRAERSPIE